MARAVGLTLAILALLGPACDRSVAGGSADGVEIFNSVCARCHGPSGEPNASMVARLGVKPLTSEHVRNDLSDEDIRQQILRGSKNRQMPAFQGALSEEQIRAVIDYVRTLRRPAEAPEKSAAPVSLER